MTVHIHTQQETRQLWRAIGNGTRCRCPRCGEGKLFRAYLKVVDECAVCGEALHHHRADDLPPYIGIVIIGHILVGVLLHMELSMHVAPWLYLLTLVPLAVILPVLLLPPIKGAVVGIQWANQMHGFGLAPGSRPTADEI